MTHTSTGFLITFALLGGSAEALAGSDAVVAIDPGELSCSDVLDFEDLAAGVLTGTNYDGALVGDGIAVGERFTGQSVSPLAQYDAVDGDPTGPLSLEVGAPGHNVAVVTLNDGFSPDLTNAVMGLGTAGHPEFTAIGEGAVAVLFDVDQAEVGFDVLGSTTNNTTVTFYARDGSVLDTSSINQQMHRAFRTQDGQPRIAGLGFVTTDPGGIALDDFCYEAEAPECFLVIGDAPGEAPYFAADHLFQTQVDAVQASHAVWLDQLPQFVLPAPAAPLTPGGVGVQGAGGGTGTASTAPVTPRWLRDGAAVVQVVMWNPEVFPGQPEQFSAGLLVQVRPDGQVVTQPYGASVGGLEVWAEVRTNAFGQEVLVFPFSIPGF